MCVKKSAQVYMSIEELGHCIQDCHNFGVNPSRDYIQYIFKIRCSE